MAADSDHKRVFRDRLKQSRSACPDQWESSRRLLTPSTAANTLARLTDAIRGSALPDELRHALVEALLLHGGEQSSSPARVSLSDLTGLPPSKALRALCIEFGLLDDMSDDGSDKEWSAERLEAFLRAHPNPYDLLREVRHPSLLDLGAGDLSFLAEVADAYRPRGERQGAALPHLTLHGVDRIRPGSRLGARYQPAVEHLARLSASQDSWLHFKYWGDQDMCALERLGRQALSRYTIVTCHAPASPTFAYEPSRLSAAVIEVHLRETRGASRRVREAHEEALEVQEGNRTLLFPPWKFEIRGPLALLRLITQRGQIGILSCVDADVFWELISQLVEVPALHVCPTVLTPALLSRHLGPAYKQLVQLAENERLVLGEILELRRALSAVTTTPRPSGTPPVRFRYVEVRRGAHFPGMPASRTARLFHQLAAETTPWMLILVPDRPVELG